MARLVALRHCGESESVPGCLFHGTGTRCRPFSVTRPETQTNAQAQGKPDFSEGIPSTRAMLWGIKCRHCFFERRPWQLFLVFFISDTLYCCVYCPGYSYSWYYWAYHPTFFNHEWHMLTRMEWNTFGIHHGQWKRVTWAFSFVKGAIPLPIKQGAYYPSFIAVRKSTWWVRWDLWHHFNII